ncbi:MAG TPA: helicase [Oscillatoriaceae cyanobacterium M33_DOE_052]|nr:helicase [Oscillatoriaceae cyanobacterium M33_DOE_052]
MVVKPEAGQIVRVRSRQYLVEEVIIPPRDTVGDTTVCLSCLDDDDQGKTLEVFWEREVEARILGAASWEAVTSKGFDNPRYFSAYYHALRWNCVTSTNPKLFQAPYRAGIEVKTYQLEPLRKALLMPRVSIFIADDVGLGKTIEAGLILREMLMRQKIKRVVISCPPSVVRQWQEEMESRFGLQFQIFDREFIAAKQRELGYGINPWTTSNQFIISHALLRDEAYAGPLRDWLGNWNAGSMLILDEAHNAAPATSSRYAIDSQLTKTVRDLAPRFEHKLFLSATPHNGHSNSFTALLEMLDPLRFCRGVPVNQGLLQSVMVRRLKQDLWAINPGDFPERLIIPIVVDGLPEDAPELKLARLLQEYRNCRTERLQTASKSVQNTAALVMTSLQKRLLSSIEAFARTLKFHRAAIATQAEKRRAARNFPLLQETPGADDDRAEIPEQDIQAEEDIQMTAATQSDPTTISQRELELLEEMTEIAQQSRYQSDGRIAKLVEWIKQNQCPDLGQPGAQWNHRRILIFTEYVDTKGYLEKQLSQAIAHSDQEYKRIETFTGGMSEDRREQIKSAFNADPKDHPLRILIATDAAREGINLQNYCADLFHFDIPWNPSRMEQRNGRIDRKLQREPQVRCHYFYLRQRPEDRVLDVLMKKTNIIKQELGSLSPVIHKNIAQILENGIWAENEASLAADIDRAASPEEAAQQKKTAVTTELEPTRKPQSELAQEQTILEDMLREAKRWLALDDRLFRDALCASLEIMGAPTLTPLDPNAAVNDPERALWQIPLLHEREGAAPAWANVLDSLRPPRKKGQQFWQWRQETTIRPVVFRDPGNLSGEVVHLHLEHRLVRRLLARFLSQGFVYHELSRACICFTDDPVPKVLILGRLSLYGNGASRLHDEIIAVAAEWLPPEARGRGKLRPLAESEKTNILQTLDNCLATPRLRDVPETLHDRFKPYAPRDVEDLLPHLNQRAETAAAKAQSQLERRSEKEAKEMKELLEKQRDRIVQQKQQYLKEQKEPLQLKLWQDDEKRQIEADYRHWDNRITQLDQEIETEPEKIRQSYQIKARRIEPVGLVYLWPVSN